MGLSHLLKIIHLMKMKIEKEHIIEGATAISIWIIPWLIALTIVFFYQEQIYLEPFMMNGSKYLILFLCAFYIVSSIFSFVGFVLPIFKGKDLSALFSVDRPRYNEHFSSNGRRLLKKAKSDKVLLFASNITIRDFLYHYYETSKRYSLVKFIPSLGQMRNYPYESLCMMLNSQKEIQGLDTDKYYNFDLIIKTCLKEE